MQTSAFITYLAEGLNASYGRARILEMVNIAQNEILGQDNALTSILPTPYLHTGSIDFTGEDGPNVSGSETFTVQEAIPSTTPTQGYLNVTEGGVTTTYKYDGIIWPDFILADGILLTSTYTTAATATVDKFRCIASGCIFSSVDNFRTTQWDIRNVSRVYSMNYPGMRSRAYNWLFSSRPENSLQAGSDEIDIPIDTTDSLIAEGNDCEIVLWRENDPGVSSDIFLVDCQKWPTQLVTEDVALTIPEAFQTTLLKFAVLRTLEYTEYGRNDFSETMYQKYLSIFHSKMRSRQQSKTLQPRPLY